MIKSCKISNFQGQLHIWHHDFQLLQSRLHSLELLEDLFCSILGAMVLSTRSFPGEADGKPMGKSWRIWETPWKNNGKPWKTHGKIRGKPMSANMHHEKVSTGEDIDRPRSFDMQFRCWGSLAMCWVSCCNQGSMVWCPLCLKWESSCQMKHPMVSDIDWAIVPFLLQRHCDLCMFTHLARKIDIEKLMFHDWTLLLFLLGEISLCVSSVSPNSTDAIQSYQPYQTIQHHSTTITNHPNHTNDQTHHQPLQPSATTTQAGWLRLVWK